MVESQSTALPLGYARQKIFTIEKKRKLFIGADSGNRTRTSCLEGKGTTTMQYPLNLIIRLIVRKKKDILFDFYKKFFNNLKTN